MDPPSPEDYDDHASDADSTDGQPIKEESPSRGAAGSAHPKPGGHLQKRRRVTRACDECRRKKIKCDGKQPCTHCTVYSYDCTYGQPSNRRRNPAPQYIENLEHRVYRAETLLHILFPNLDLNNPGIDAAVAQGWIPGAPGKGGPPGQEAPQMPPPPPSQPANTTEANENNADPNLESMVPAFAQIDLDDTGHWHYHGHSSGISFIKRMREQLGDLMYPEVHGSPFVKAMQVHHVLDSPKSSPNSPIPEGGMGHSALPPKALARRMCSNAIDDAASLLRVIHHPSFWQSFERVYSLSPDNYSNQDHVFLPLLYSVMALGSLFGKDGGDDQEGYETALQQGLAYFKAARHMMDIADCRDLPHVQAVVFMILFLQSTAKLNQCYVYIGIALRSACRMGMHRASPGQFDPVENETRKRLFWTIRNLDVYVGAMLGLPMTLPADDIDQEFPLEVDDEFITREGVRPAPAGSESILSAFNVHTRLVDILTKIMRKIYPIKFQTPLGMGDKSYSVPFSSIREIESDLEAWKNSLPGFLAPSDAHSPHARAQQLLRMAYAHAQVMLYRPFLHFVAMEKRVQATDQRAYACAASFINVSRNIIHIQAQMKQRGLLNGAYWFAIYTTFFSVLALVYYAAENPDQPTHAVMKDALEGKQVLASLAPRSMAADRCTITLDSVFERLPPWMREGRPNPAFANSKKRVAPTSGSSASAELLRDHTTVTRRASTFPALNSPNPQQQQSQGGSPFDRAMSQAPAPTSAYQGPSTPTSGTFDLGAAALNGFAGAVHSAAGAAAGLAYPVPSRFGNPALVDMSNMMFPTADEPFVYPNQPLTAFENSHIAQYGSGAGKAAGMMLHDNGSHGSASGLYNLSGNTATASPPPGGNTSQHGGAESTGGDIEAHIFALPPYIQQRPQLSALQRQQLQQMQQQQQQQQQFASYTDNRPMTALSSSLPSSNGGWENPQQRFSQPQPQGQGQQPGMQTDLGNIVIPDLFGGTEWGPAAAAAAAAGMSGYGNGVGGSYGGF